VNHWSTGIVLNMNMNLGKPNTIGPNVAEKTLTRDSEILGTRRLRIMRFSDFDEAGATSRDQIICQ
jgi:hypothetical protein